MPRATLVFRPLVLVGLALLPGSCAPRGEQAAETPVSATPNVVELSATEYALEAPDTVPAGWLTLSFTNRGHEVHYGHIVRLEPGRTVDELVAAYAEAIRTSGPRPSWVTRFGGPGGAAPGQASRVTQYLEPGEYVWICPVEDESGAPHFGKGEFKRFVVGPWDGPPADAAAGPVADLVIRLEDFGFGLDSVLPSGHHIVRVENIGVEPHDLVMLRLAEGVTLDDVQTWLNPERARRDRPSDEPPPSFENLGTGAGGIAAMRSGMAGFFEADLSPGEYVLMCMATAPDGRSHIEHGMIRHVSVR